jgi:hypothetical protein
LKRSGRKSAAQTPAPPSERIKGSSINKPGSASSKESASDIVLSESIIEVLREKADMFNEEHPGNRVGLPELKAVMRRGMGAYSTSHRPTISGGKPNSRTAWGYARVNRFLEKKAGKKVKDAYVQDDDLLEGGGEIELLAPNGQPSNLSPEQYKLVRTPEFKAWFGDFEKAFETGNYDEVSKVIDSNGEPLVCFHGTGSEFNIFKIGRTGGLFFTNKENSAKRFSEGDLKREGDSPKILKVFLKIKKPFSKNTIDHELIDSFYGEYFKNRPWISKKSQKNIRNQPFFSYQLVPLGVVIEESLKEVLKRGYDGLTFEADMESTTFVVFDSNQIKLADGSNTTFDAENPDIRFDDGGQVPPNFEIGASYPYPPAEISDYVKESDYWLPIRKFYFESEDAPLSSRYHPYLSELPKVGSWRISRLNLMDGHGIDYLAELPIDILTPKELDSEGNLDAAKRGDDERYADWIKAGFRSIPIEVVQREDGKFLITDGHRRYLAHKLAGKDTIEAWVSYSAISPRGTIVGLTYELAHLNKQIPSFELGGAVNESNDLTFASYDDALLWLEKESKKYKSKNDFYSSYEYKKAYPVINELYMLERRKDESKEREEAKIAMEQAGVKFGDRVGYDYIVYLQVEEYTGEVISRNGIPYVKLDEGQQTMTGKKSVKWHKGWRKITDGEQTNE